MKSPMHSQTLTFISAVIRKENLLFCTGPCAQTFLRGSSCAHLIVCCTGPSAMIMLKYMFRGSSRAEAFHCMLRGTYRADRFETFLLRGSNHAEAFHCMLHGNLPRIRVFLQRRICTYSPQWYCWIVLWRDLVISCNTVTADAHWGRNKMAVILQTLC